MADTQLDRLADAAGIEPRYWDIQGGLHERSPETARVLLRAMGLPAESDGDVVASLNALREEEWREALPPVLVVREGQGFEVPVRLPGSEDSPQLRWTITREDDAETKGQWDAKSANAQAQSQSGGNDIELKRFHVSAQPLGYHRLCVEGIAECALVVVPRCCYLPPDWDASRYWGMALQLYAVRSARNWGIGDFGDLAQLMGWHADTVGLNPLHALFLDAPEAASPYAPCSRLFVNPLYLDVEAVGNFLGLEVGNPPEIRDVLARAKASGDVNYTAVAAAKLTELNRLFRAFAAGAGTRRDEFHAFVTLRGRDLDHFATFQVLSEHFGTHQWSQWPGTFRDPGVIDVRTLITRLEDRHRFFAFLQWQADVQLSATAAASRVHGLRLGIYRDLAVSSDAQSADHWANQATFMGDARVGAPPDPFNEAGQEWGIVPLNPRRLHAQAYAYFIALLRANMRYAGALRIDHVMGLMRLFVIPAGALPRDGAYLRFPFEDLLGILALESLRNKCVVIGEDLGTVPMGFRERMADAGVLSSRVLYFEREHGRFRKPADFPSLAAVSVSTHDLATLRGYWTEADIRAKEAAGIFDSPEEQQRAQGERANDKALLFRALADEDLLPPGIDPDQSWAVQWSEELSLAVHIYLARSQSKLFLVQLDDLAGEEQQANLPGNAPGYPSWRRRLHRSLDELSGNSKIHDAIAAVVRARRPDSN
jgi:4-alpha-glucanotransferase